MLICATERIVKKNKNKTLSEPLKWKIWHENWTTSDSILSANKQTTYLNSGHYRSDGLYSVAADAKKE